ncbi:beta-alanine-activating enzyme-like [Diadema setosum]|uniref:beta-alanine-activating enzyme-like n=1 Tax=Diadema setosum TaxID=31175 RepID=UPI003B3B8D57
MIGLYVEPAVQLPSWILGVLQLPAAFAPIDPHAPTAMNEYFIRKLNISILCVQVEYVEHFIDSLGRSFDWAPCQKCRQQPMATQSGVIQVRLLSVKHQQGPSTGSDPPCSTALAYALHTSGTTGKPKVVRVPHRCIVPNIQHLRDTFSITEDDVVFMASPLTFDPCMVEMFMTWSRGATLVMVPAQVKMAPRSLAEVLIKHHVSILQATPSLVGRFPLLMLREDLLGADSALRLLAFGGEACPPPSTLARWRGSGNQTEFHNLYGITEVSSWASCFKIPHKWLEGYSNKSIPLGDPLKGTILTVRNERGQEVTSGQGQLYIGGTERVCYLDDDKESDITGSVMRASGDVVEFKDEGLVYVGRLDDQTKRHGKRISLSGIKQAIETCAGVKSCAVFLMNGKLIACCTSTMRLPSSQPAANSGKSSHAKMFPKHGSHVVCSSSEGRSSNFQECNSKTDSEIVTYKDSDTRTLNTSSSPTLSLSVLPSNSAWLDAKMAHISHASIVNASFADLADRDATSSPQVCQEASIVYDTKHSGAKDLSAPKTSQELKAVLPSATVHSPTSIQDSPLPHASDRNPEDDDTSRAEASSEIPVSDLKDRDPLPGAIALSTPSSDLLGSTAVSTPSSDSWSDAKILSHLRDILPGHAIPDRLIPLREMPITRHGKVDTAALQEAARRLEEEEAASARQRGKMKHPWETWKAVLVKEWTTCLGRDLLSPVHDEDSFTALGGDSFLALRLVQCLELAYQATLPDLLDAILHHTFQRVCACLQQCLEDTGTSEGSPQAPQGDAGSMISQEEGPGILNWVSNGRQSQRPSGRAPSVSPWQEESALLGNDSTHVGTKEQVLRNEEAGPLTVKRSSEVDGVVAFSAKRTRVDNKVSNLTTHTSPHGNTVPQGAAAPPHGGYLLSLRRGSNILCHQCPAQDKHSQCTSTLPKDQSLYKVDTKHQHCELYIAEKWRVDTGKCVDASPLIVKTSTGTNVFIGSHSGRFLAIAMETGEVLWQTILTDRVESSACLSACGKFVIVGCYDHYVYCLLAATGTIAWKYRMLDIVKCSPVCDATNGFVYVGSHDQSVAALHVDNKCCVWKTDCGEGSVLASPCIHHPSQTLYVATLRGAVVALDKETGVKKWLFRCTKPIFSSPAGTSEGIVVGSVDGTVQLVSHTGRQLWSYRANGPIFSSLCLFPTRADTKLHSSHPEHHPTHSEHHQPCPLLLFGSHDGRVTCLNSSTGCTEWTKVVSTSPVYSTPYVLTHRERYIVVVTATDGCVHILDLLTGQKVAEHSLPGEVFSSPVVDERNIIVGCRNDYVYCLELKG